MKRLKKLPILLLGLSLCGTLLAGPHKIRILGDLIVKEGTEAEYTVTVKNVSDKDFEDLVVNVESFSDASLAFCSATSEMMHTLGYDKVNSIGIEAYMKRLPRKKTASLTIKVKACHLEKKGDLKSQWITVSVDGDNFRRGVIKRSATIYKV